MKAWIENGAVREVAPGNPDELYHPDVARHFDTEVPPGTLPGAQLIQGQWVNPLPPEPVQAPPAPPAPPPVPPVRHITQLAFLSRFTDAEAIAIDLASQGATVQAASMRRYQAKVNAASYIDLDRADTRAGVQALESAGLLSAGRALAILDAAVQEHERYRA